MKHVKDFLIWFYDDLPAYHSIPIMVLAIALMARWFFI